MKNLNEIIGEEFSKVLAESKQKYQLKISEIEVLEEKYKDVSQYYNNNVDEHGHIEDTKNPILENKTQKFIEALKKFLCQNI